MLLILLVALLIGAAPASAATVEAKSECDKVACAWHIDYAAAPGERNELTVTSAPGVVEIHDAGAPVSGCTPVDPHTARCATAVGESALVSADLGDGDDVVRGGGVAVDPGPGSDLIEGPAAVQDDDPAEPDRYLGPISLVYSGREDDLRIDLPGHTVAPDGDVIGDVHLVYGGKGDDLVIGTDAADELFGGPGADRVQGRGGDDTLYTDDYVGALVHADPKGRDILDGGAGDDRLVIGSRHRAGNVLRCGAGHDFVDQTQRQDFVGGDCEKLAIGPSLHIRVRIHPRSHRFLWDPDRGGLTARHGRTVIARGAHALRLNAAGRRLLARHGRLRISVSLHGPDPGGFRMELRR